MGASLDVPDLSPAEWQEDTLPAWIEGLEHRSWVVRDRRRGSRGNQ